MSAIRSRLNSSFIKALLWPVTGVALASAASLAVPAQRDDQSAANRALPAHYAAPVPETSRLALQYTTNACGWELALVAERSAVAANKISPSPKKNAGGAYLEMSQSPRGLP